MSEDRRIECESCTEEFQPESDETLCRDCMFDEYPELFEEDEDDD